MYLDAVAARYSSNPSASLPEHVFGNKDVVGGGSYVTAYGDSRRSAGVPHLSDFAAGLGSQNQTAEIKCCSSNHLINDFFDHPRSSDFRDGDDQFVRSNGRCGT